MKIANRARELALALACVSCSQLTSVDVSVTTTASLPAQQQLTPIALGNGFSSFGDSFSSALSGSGNDLSHVQSAHITNAHLAAKDDGDLSFLSSVTFTLSATGLPDVKLATQTVFPKLTPSVSFDVDSNVEMLPYLQAGNATVKPAVVYATAAGRTVPVEAGITLHLKLKF